MNKLKICLVLPPYLPVPAVRGGAIETLAEELIKLNEKYGKLEIDCVSIYDKNAKKSYSNYTNTKFLSFKVCRNYYIDNFYRAISFIIRKISGINIRKIIRDAKYNKLILNSDYDFVIFEGMNPHINEKIVNKVGKERLILHLHRTAISTNYLEKMYQYFIGISNYVSNAFLNNGIIDRDRVYTLYNGIDLSAFEKRITVDEKHNLKIKYSIEDDKIILIYVGRLLPEKGVKELIIAYKNMKLKNKCKLLIVGSASFDTNHDTEYSKELKRLADGEDIIFTGFVKNSELYKYYGISDIAIFPSTGEEGFGLVLVEAMHCKLPIIATNSGGMAEVVSKECAIIVELNEKLINSLSNAMDELCENEELRKNMSNASYIKSLDFDIKNYYDNYVKILYEIKGRNNERKN